MEQAPRSKYAFRSAPRKISRPTDPAPRSRFGRRRLTTPSCGEWPSAPPGESPSGGHLREAGPVVHAFGPEEHEVRVASLLLVHGVGLEQGGAPRTRVVDGAPEERLGDTSSSRSTIDEETHDRPDRLVIDWLHDR